MSHADFHRDSSSTDSGASSAPVPSKIVPVNPLPNPAAVVPPPPPPPAPTAVNPPVPPAARTAVPPPPPRATLPPVRPAAQRNVPSGVGTATGVRWRGELDGVNRSSAAKPATLENASDPHEDREPDHVARTAPPWLISMVLHLVLLLILALVSTPAGASLGRVMLSIGQSERESPAELTEFTIASDEMMVDSEAMEDSEVEVDLPSVFDSPQLSEMEEIAPVDLGVGAEQIAIARPMFNGRSGAMKQALLAIYGGTPQTQDAVKRGLEWLKRNQKKDGSWSMRGPYNDGGISENESAATAMALLAFLGDGHTHQGGDYAEQVEKGMRFLISKQDRSGFFSRDARSHEKMYAQAQATIAICELYGMTKDSWLRDRAQLAIDFAQKAQAPEGGWRYEPKFDSDTSVTGWFVMALQSGRSAGLEVDSTVLNRISDYLDTAASYDDAAYSYQARGNPSPAMTAEGLLCRQYLDWKRDHPPLARGIDALLVDAPFDLSDRDVYYWYYATQVLHHYGGPPWQRWNEVMRNDLPKAQVKGSREDGSWAPQMDRWGRNHGRLYTTCLSLYCLEVYYRHMPLYHVSDTKKP